MVKKIYKAAKWLKQEKREQFDIQVMLLYELLGHSWYDTGMQKSHLCS